MNDYLKKYIKREKDVQKLEELLEEKLQEKKLLEEIIFLLQKETKLILKQKKQDFKKKYKNSRR